MSSTSTTFCYAPESARKRMGSSHYFDHLESGLCDRTMQQIPTHLPEVVDSSDNLTWAISSPFAPSHQNSWDLERGLGNKLCESSFLSPLSPYLVEADTDAELDDDEDESDSDSEAQYITIPPKTLWWHRVPRLPVHKSPSPSSSLGCLECRSLYDCDCDSLSLSDSEDDDSVLSTFCKEIQRIIPSEPGSSSFEFDFDFDLDDSSASGMNSGLLTTPIRAFYDTCWDSVLPDDSPVCHDMKPLPDVPTDLDGHWAEECYPNQCSVDDERYLELGDLMAAMVGM